MKKAEAYLETMGVQWEMNHIDFEDHQTSIDTEHLRKIYKIEGISMKTTQATTERLGRVFGGYGHFRIRNVEKLMEKLGLKNKNPKLPQKVLTESFFVYNPEQGNCSFFFVMESSGKELEKLIETHYPESKLQKTFSSQHDNKAFILRLREDKKKWVETFQTTNIASLLEEEFFPLVEQELNL